MATSVNQAIDIILNKVKSVSYELLPIELCLNRVSFETLNAKFNLPRFNNSAMDGYGFKLEDIKKPLKIIETILAGDNKDIEIKNNETIKIMTGARVPQSVNVIAPQENTTTDENGESLYLNHLLADDELRESLSEEEIRECFNYDYYTKNVENIFKRVFK